MKKKKRILVTGGAGFIGFHLVEKFLQKSEEISINQLAKKVKNLTNSFSKIIRVPYKKAYPSGYEDFRRRVPDISKIKELINYRPRASLEDSIKKIIKYYQG